LEHINIVYGEATTHDSWASSFPIQIFYGIMQPKATEHVKYRGILFSFSKGVGLLVVLIGCIASIVNLCTDLLVDSAL